MTTTLHAQRTARLLPATPAQTEPAPLAGEAYARALANGAFSRRSREIQYELYRRGPQTIEGLARAIGCKESGVTQTRMNLTAAGVIRACGRLQNRTRYWAIAWALTPAARRVLESLAVEGRLETALLQDA